MSSRIGFVSVCAAVLTTGLAAPGGADQAGCQKQLVQQLAKYEKTAMKVWGGCFDLRNVGKYPAPCLNEPGQLKLMAVDAKVDAAIGSHCTLPDLTALGFSTSCADYGPPPSTFQCASLPAGTVAQIADCLQCWSHAYARTYVAKLYASNAVEACNGSVVNYFFECQPPACADPLPEQRVLGEGGDSFCQKGIGKAATKYALKRTKVLGSCALSGGTSASCLADAAMQQKLAGLAAKNAAVIQNRCGNVDPEPTTAFCCRTGAGNECVAAATRMECLYSGHTVQDQKFCDVDSTCGPLGGDKQFPWWGSCPDSDPCPGTALSTTGGMTTCVEGVADRLVDRLLCMQVPRNGGADWPCPASPSGAFLE